MHIPRNEFDDMEYSVFMEAFYQYKKAEQDNARLMWEIARFQTGTLVRPNLKNPNIPTTEIVKFPWDDEDDKIKKELDRQAISNALSEYEKLFHVEH